MLCMYMYIYIIYVPPRYEISKIDRRVLLVARML